MLPSHAREQVVGLRLLHSGSPGNRWGAPGSSRGCCAAGPGTTIRRTRARPIATTTIRTIATTTWVFGWCVRLTSAFVPSGSGKSRRSRLAGCGDAHRPRSAAPNNSETLPQPPRGASPLCVSSLEGRWMARVRPVRTPRGVGHIHKRRRRLSESFAASKTLADARGSENGRRFERTYDIGR